MSADYDIERAFAAAVAKEQDGRLQEAFDLYQIALGITFEECKKTSDTNKKASLQRIIVQYMNVAESIKKKIESAPPPAATKNEDTGVTGMLTSMLFGKPSPRTTEAPPSTIRKPDTFDYTPAGREIKANTKKQVIQPIINTSPKPSVSKQAGSSSSLIGSSTPTSSTPKTTTGANTNNSTAGASKPAADGDKLGEYEKQIQEEMLDRSPGVGWSDIAGLAFAKQTLQEAVILPNLRPDLFTGLRAPPKGVLLYGPPGTGKTLLAKAVATESGFSFFSITASSVTSKYLGEGEKLMRALFSCARRLQPSVIFLDEIDSLMSARKEGEHEASRRVKTEFMTQLDGATTSAEDRLLIMGATNLPWELDEAVLRRLVKRIYIPLPDDDARSGLIKHLIRKHLASSAASKRPAQDPPSSSGMFSSILGSRSSGTGGGGADSVPGFSDADIRQVVRITEGYSGSDLSAVCHEAAMGPIRELGFAALKTVKPEEVRQLAVRDFEGAVKTIRPSVSPDSLEAYVKWGDQFGASK